MAAAAATLAVLAGAGTWTALAGDEPVPVRRADQVVATGGGVRLDTSYFTAGGTGRRPAVLLAHGFGGSKADVRAQAERPARDGYAVLTWSARGFGESTGRIGLNAPDGEVADVSRLLDRLAERPEAVGGAVGLTIIGNVLDEVTALGDWRELLPAHWQYAWLDALAPRLETARMLQGASLSLTCALVLTVLAFRGFARKDIVS